MPISRLCAIFIASNLLCSAALAEVTVHTGPTYIPRGDAIGDRDITINNGKFAVAFAVDTAPPWGVARGGIIDIAVVREGKVGYDIASLADFLPNSWTNWPTTYQSVEITERSAQHVLVEVERDWGDVQLVTTFRITAGDSLIHIVTEMTNGGDGALDNLKSGYVMWPDGGSMFGVPGLYGFNAASEERALADWTAAYGENWVLALHAPYATFVEYDGQDRYATHALGPGDQQTFAAWLQIDDQGALSQVVDQQIRLTGVAAGQVSGQVTSSEGKVIETPAVVAYRDGQPFAWAIGENGRYELELPVGSYELFATAKGHSQGASQSVVVSADKQVDQDFADVEPPGVLHFQVSEKDSGRPLDARITVEQGPEPLIGYFGRSTLFTELQKIGEVTSGFAPGDYVFSVSAAGGFESQPYRIEQQIAPGSVHDFDVVIETLAEPRTRGWYSADLHHHSDVLDGTTEPEYVMRSELAAGLDITFLSDHDSVVNNAAMQQLAESRSVLFMPGTEMSPSWAHFNAFPLDVDKQIRIDPGQSTVQEIFAEARRMGADVIEANHPYMGYGYFNSRDKEMIPGGYDAGFELVEIEAAFHNGGQERNQLTVEAIWQLWNNRERKYLAAGSDAHDVWAEPSGAARTYVHIEGELTIDAYVAGLLRGNSFASQGPLVYPEIMFGNVVTHAAGEPLTLSYTLQAVSGLRSARIVSGGEVITQGVFRGETSPTKVSWNVEPEADTWYSIIVEDNNGNLAYSNPIWVTVVD